MVRQPNPAPGKLIIFSGPSGVGKKTVLNEIFFYNELNLVYAVSLTTRKPRLGELNGVDYYFVSEAEFQQAIQDQKLIEYVNFIGHYYGTLKSEVENKMKHGHNVILEIEVDGSMKVLQKFPEAISFFLLPPSIEVLELRMRNRKTEKEETIRRRVAKAEQEIKMAHFYKYQITNFRLSDTVKKVHQILERELITTPVDQNHV